LLVVCSEEAARSSWVCGEIERFRELHPDRPIIPVIAGLLDIEFDELKQRERCGRLARCA
jgi:hypothetical protein